MPPDYNNDSDWQRVESKRRGTCNGNLDSDPSSFRLGWMNGDTYINVKLSASKGTFDTKWKVDGVSDKRHISADWNNKDRREYLIIRFLP